MVKNKGPRGKNLNTLRNFGTGSFVYSFVYYICSVKVLGITTAIFIRNQIKTGMRAWECYIGMGMLGFNFLICKSRKQN